MANIKIGTKYNGIKFYGDRGRHLTGHVVNIKPSKMLREYDIITIAWNDGQKAMFFRRHC